MLVAALMPTYRRPRLAANALACFLAQSHPDKRLLICDDSGELRERREKTWAVVRASLQTSLPAKYNHMAQIAIKRWYPDALVVMEDDDVYLRDYLANHVRGLEVDPWQWNAKDERWEAADKKISYGWSHCSWVWTDGSGGGPGGALRRENTGHGRLHGCMAMSVDAWGRVGGWPETPRMDFDLQMLSRLRGHCQPADPCFFGPSQYYFRWASTHDPHGQAHSTGPGDEGWLKKARAAIDARRGPIIPDSIDLEPALDEETARLLQREG